MLEFEWLYNDQKYCILIENVLLTLLLYFFMVNFQYIEFDYGYLIIYGTIQFKTYSINCLLYSFTISCLIKSLVILKNAFN